MSGATLGKVYKEVKRIDERLDLIEDLLEEIIVRELPEEKLSEREVKEIKRSVEEMKKGEYASLGELKGA
ncbi:MAG: hypothetical protein U9M97_01565 [Candidatus Hadarchaeota archaeon]|nr:hypothetical protein [Candidatus Hadarchaeota archaeon]